MEIGKPIRDRFLLKVSNPKILIDHIDRNGLNCTRDNLRICTSQENSHNSRPRPKRSQVRASSYKGVVWRKEDKVWQAAIQVGKQRIHLGRFDSEEDAARAYDKAAAERHGKFAFLNFPLPEVVQ